MNITQHWTPREKFLVFIIILLLTSLLASKNPALAASNNETIQQDRQLYLNAKTFAQQGDLGLAVANTYAYIQRNPQEYANDFQKRNEIDTVFWKWVTLIREDQAFRAYVESSVANCQVYPCALKDSCEVGSGSSFLQVVPPGFVQVCENINSQGKCSFLRVGEYTNWRNLGVGNDSISSVRLGANVKVLLCQHNLSLLSSCLEFTVDDYNLTDNILPGTNISLNDRVSTARVTFKPGLGLTLP
jgi:hypothetical protein